MLNLMKYEWIRGKKLLGIGIAVLLILEIIMVITLRLGDNYLILFGILSFFLYPASYVFILIDGARMISKDLNETQGYMLFLTPNSGYRIVNSKLLVNLINFLVCQFIVIAIYVLNYHLALKLYLDNGPEFIMMLKEMVNELLAILLPSPWLLLLGILALVLNWFSFITTVYLAIILRKSLFSNVRFKGFLSFAIFVGLNIAVSWVSNAVIVAFSFTAKLGDQLSNMNNLNQDAYLSIIFQYVGVAYVISIVFIVLFTYLSGLLVHKRIDL
ncbi:MAG: hypothetical protein JW708_05705 [Vallitaleaceae bacterium]|nr:hypothetical protein [Vallitaleaceae bacterium]